MSLLCILQEPSIPIIPSTKEVSTQTLLSWTEIRKLEVEREIKDLDQQSFEKYDSASRKLTYYTGLPNLSLFLLILNVINDYLSTIRVQKLSNFQKLLIVLMKMRLHVDFTDLSYRFNVRKTSISKLFKKTVICLEHCFGDFINWPDRLSLEGTMPNVFRVEFGNRVRGIIDCFEIGIQRPSTLDAKAHTFSNYKGKNTIQYLICITPQGSISFISKGYGGRISD